MDCKIKLIKNGNEISVEVEGRGYDLIFTLVTIMKKSPGLVELFDKSLDLVKALPENVDVDEALSDIQKMENYINNLLKNNDGTVN